MPFTGLMKKIKRFKPSSVQCGDSRELDQDMIGVGRNVKLANILRFVAGKVRPLGLEGLGMKVKEVFEESKVS